MRLLLVFIPLRRMQHTAGTQDAALTNILKRHGAEEQVDLVAQLFPQIMRQTPAAIGHTALAGIGIATCHANRLIHGHHNIGYAQQIGAARQHVTAAGSAHALDQTGLAQFAEQLLQIGQGNILTVGNIGERHGVVFSVHDGAAGEIHHRHNRIAAFGTKFHVRLPFLSKVAGKASRV